jgi:hypothetical protein
MAELNTYGDLKKVIKSISSKQKGEKIGQVALDTVIGLIPGAGNAKTTYDFIKAAFSKPDTKKTDTWLDKLDIDDEMSSIVDDTVENGFLQTLSKTIESQPDNTPLESDFNMNAKMVDYLKTKYGGRTITGITEKQKQFNMKDRFQKLAGIKEVAPTTPTTPNPNKPDSSVATISKDLEDQSSNFKNISTKEKMEQLLDALVGKLTPEFKESPAFKQAVLSFYNKNK